MLCSQEPHRFSGWISQIEENRSESFECWLEDGEVFKNLKEDGEDIDVQKCIEIAKKLSPIVDKLSNTIEVINEEEFEKLAEQ